MTSWTEYYLSQLPVKWQGGTGSCAGQSFTYAMEMCAMRRGYSPVQLSAIFNYWCAQDPRHDIGGASVEICAAKAQFIGVCRESLHPNLPYAGVDTTTQAWSDATYALVKQRPSPEAFADAANHKIVSYTMLPGTIALIKASIDSGCPVVFFDPPNHYLCAWDYINDGVTGLDSRSQNGMPGFIRPWSTLSPGFLSLQDVVFNVAKGPPLGVRPPEIIVVPPIPPTTGVNTVTRATIISQATALPDGPCTQAAKDALAAEVQQLVVEVLTPPAGSDVIPGSGSLTDAHGVVWSIKADGLVLRNGANASGFFASQLRFAGRVEGKSKASGNWRWYNDLNGTWNAA